MLTKTQLKKVLTDNDIRLKKSWGQNFLIDKNIKDKIIKTAGLGKDDFVIEIGAGLGAITEGLAEKAGRVAAIEKDRKLCAVLKEILKAFDNVTVLEGDVLGGVLGDTFQLVKTSEGKCPLKIVGNLPYYITTPILFKLLEFRERIDSMLVTVQKEVAQRITAPPGTKDYSPLSLGMAYYTKPSLEMLIKRTAFFPQPEVDSRLVRLQIRDSSPVSVKDEKLLFKIIRTAFGQRRKTLANALEKAFPNIKTALEEAGIDTARRAETLSLEEFGSITNAIDNPA